MHGDRDLYGTVLLLNQLCSCLRIAHCQRSCQSSTKTPAKSGRSQITRLWNRFSTIDKTPVTKALKNTAKNTTTASPTRRGGRLRQMRDANTPIITSDVMTVKF